MKPQVTILSLLLLIFWLQLSAQKVDLTLKFNSQIAEYEVYAKPDFTKGEFLIGSGSQITVLIPDDFVDNRLITKSVSGGNWVDQTPIYAPESFPSRDFHTFVSNGGTIQFENDQAQRLFSFSLPIGYDSKEIRLFAKGFDPLPSSKGMQGRNLANYLPNDISLTDFYGNIYAIPKDIKGGVKDWRGYPIEGVEVTVGNQKMTAPFNGLFEFANVPVSNDVYFHFNKKIDPIVGISIADVIALQKHLSGEQKFTQTYQWIAADVDQSGKVTKEDLFLLQKIIAQPSSAFTRKIGWTYIPSDWLKTGVLYEAAYGQKVKLSYAERVFAVDFTAIKMGDIDGSYTQKENIPTNIQPSAKALTINLLNIKMQQGQAYKIPFSTAEIQETVAYQLAIKTENAQLGEVLPKTSTPNEAKLIQNSSEMATANWMKDINSKAVAKPVVLNNNLNAHQSDDALFSLTVIPNRNGYLSDFISITDGQTPTEAFDENGKVMKIQLLFQQAPEEEGEFEMYQNRPNPFREYTTIGYYLPNDSSVTLTLTNEAGATLKVVREEGKAGFNSFTLEGEDIEKGLIYFKIETEHGIQTKQMLHLN